jgi:hypothetical protein
MVGACNALLMWNKVGGKEVLGFTRWRQAERLRSSDITHSWRSFNQFSRARNIFLS